MRNKRFQGYLRKWKQKWSSWFSKKPANDDDFFDHPFAIF